MQENERAMYTGIINCRNMEITLQWISSQFFLLILIAAISLIARNPIHPLALFIVSVLGLGVAIFWSIIMWRASRWIHYWESRLEALERSEPGPAVTRVFSDPGYEDLTQKTFLANRFFIMPIVILFFLAIETLLLLFRLLR